MSQVVDIVVKSSKTPISAGEYIFIIILLHARYAKLKQGGPSLFARYS
jgi:hypothetical protein